MADQKLTALSEISVPALDDLLYLIDDPSGTPVSNKITLTRLLGLARVTPQGRLTTESGVAVSTSDRTSQGTLYYTPYHGNVIHLYDGTRWRAYTFSELSLALSLTSDKNYDVFVYDNAGTLTLELSAAWTNDTTRADAITTQDGVYVKSGATTRRWLGTIRASGANVTEDSGLMAAGPRRRFVWNAYNRVERPISLYDPTNSWTYGSTSWRALNNSANNRVEVVTGLAGVNIDLILMCVCQPGGSSGDVILGLGEDSTTSPMPPALGRYGGNFGTSSTFIVQGGAYAHHGVPLGYHYYSGMEKSSAGVTFTIYGDAGGDHAKSGINGSWES